MIIGSMILPGFVIYTIAAIIVINSYASAFLEYAQIISHHSIPGIISVPYYDNISALLVFCTAFGIMIILSVFFANSIASTLFLREQELEMTLDKLNEAEKVKQKYTMGVVHEIKSPVAAVQSFLDVILGNYAGPVSEQVFDKVKKARVRSDEAIQIINDVLSISKIKLQRTVLKEELNLNELLESVISRRKSQAENKNIEIVLINNTGNESTVEGDRNLLDLAFSNLIGNSIKYTNYGGRVEVVITRKEDLENTIIEVCDNGIGIPECDHDKIFNEFFRASNVKQKTHEGTGLGLSVVKQIISQHSGTIAFESPSRLADEKGEGTSFTVILPLE